MSITKLSSKIYEPSTYKEATNNPIYGRQWRKAIKKKLQNLDNHHTWEYKQLPPDRMAIGLKQVFKVKYNADGSVSKFKAKIVAQGFSQVQGIDFTKTFAPTVKRKSLCIYLAICPALNLIIYQVDIVGAYLESLLDNNEYLIFIRLLPRMYKLRQIRKKLLCRLLRSLYGLKQSGRYQNKNVIAFYKSISFRQPNSDPNILIQQTKNETSIVSIYVDDFFLAYKTMSAMQTLKDILEKEYEMKNLGKINTIIRWQITRDTAMHMMKIDQLTFIRDLVIEEGLEECNANVIPIKAGLAIEMLDSKDYNKTDLYKY